MEPQEDEDGLCGLPQGRVVLSVLGACCAEVFVPHHTPHSLEFRSHRFSQGLSRKAETAHNAIGYTEDDKGKYD